MLTPVEIAPAAAPDERYRAIVESLADGFCLLEPCRDSAAATVDYRYVVANAALEALLGVPGLHGRTVREVGVVGPALVAALDDVVRTGRPRRLEVHVPALNLWLDAHLFRPTGRLASCVGALFSNVTARRERERELRRSIEWQRVMADIGPDLRWHAAADGTTTWYNRCWFEYTGQTAADAAHLGWIAALHPQERMSLYSDWHAGGRTRFARETRIRDAHGDYRWFLLRLEPVRSDDGGAVEWLGSAADVHEQRAAYVEADRRATALRRRLASAEEEERRRLARELHDEAGQHLTAVGLGLQALTNALPPDSRLERLAADLRALTETLSRELHEFALRLRPKALDDFGLSAAVAAYAEEWSQRSGIAADVHARLVSAKLPQPIEGAVYRIVQEALTNVARHSQARRVAVVISEHDGDVHAIVEDDGRGFDVEATLGPADAKGMGLVGIRERVELLGGTVDVEAGPARGTALYVHLPIATESA